MSHGPIFLWQLIYQAKTDVVNRGAPETVSVDRWVQPLSLPTPSKPGLHASRQQFQPYGETARFPEIVSEDRWHQPWSEPSVKSKAGLPAGEQQFLAAQANPIISIPWFNWLSEPVRTRLGLAASAQQTLAVAEATPFPESITEDRWHQPWSEPVRTKLGLSAAGQQTIAFDPAVFVPFVDNQRSIPQRQPTGLAAHQQQALAFTAFVSTAVSVDGWGSQLSIPQRQLLGLPASEQQYFAYAAAAPFPETVSEDRWHQPWSEPVRTRALPASEQQALAFVPIVTAAAPPVDGWATAFADVPKSKLGLAASQQQVLALTEAAPFPETISEDRFHQPWAEPVRIKPAAQQQQTTAFDPSVFVASVDGWWSPFAEVPKPKAGTTAACQQFFAFDPAVFVSASDAWAQPWSDPPKPKVSVNVAAQQALAFDPAVFVPSIDAWQNAFSDPVRPRPTVTAEAIFFPPNFTAATVPPLDYFLALSEPQRQLAGLAARFQQDAAYGFVPIVQAFVWFFGNEEPLPWPGYRSNQFIRENYDSFVLPPFPIPNPPQTQAKFTVSGPSVSDLFPVSGVVYPYAPETRKTVP